MAPSPEYDKEPKAPDKSATCVSSDDTKVLHNLVTDQQTNSDLKPMNSIGNSDVEVRRSLIIFNFEVSYQFVRNDYVNNCL